MKKEKISEKELEGFVGGGHEAVLDITNAVVDGVANDEASADEEIVNTLKPKKSNIQIYSIPKPFKKR